MTDEVEYEEEIPEGDGPYEKGLWAEARDWVGWLVNIYGNVKEIALVGLSRRTALRCMNWLWSIEGIVRRLILAEALALDPKSLKPLAASKARPASRRRRRQADAPPQDLAEPKRPPSTFRLFALRGASSASAGTPPAQAGASERKTLPKHRHLVFPADSLLLLGPADARRPARRSPGLRRAHPLDRRGRLSRWDPGYKTDLKKEQESYRRYFFGPFPQLPDRFSRPPRARKHRDIHDPHYRGAGGADWRRVAEEWERVIPAPSLAGRIMAIHRVMANPQRWIERAARLLQPRTDLVALLRDAPYPDLIKPRRDRGPGPPGMLCLSLCHVRLLGLDTS